jgi:hypothetical protein
MKTGTLRREELLRVVMNLYRPYLVYHPKTTFERLIDERYQTRDLSLLTYSELKDLAKYMVNSIREEL